MRDTTFTGTAGIKKLKSTERRSFINDVDIEWFGHE